MYLEYLLHTLETVRWKEKKKKKSSSNAFNNRPL
jgi:hypothetical protein